MSGEFPDSASRRVHPAGRAQPSRAPDPHPHARDRAARRKLEPRDQTAADQPIDLESRRGVIGDDREHRSVERFEPTSAGHLGWDDRGPRLRDGAKALRIAARATGDGVDHPTDRRIELGPRPALRDALKIGWRPFHVATVRYRSAE